MADEKVTYADNDYSTEAVLSRLNLQGMKPDVGYVKDPETGRYGPRETAKSVKQRQNRETQKKRGKRLNQRPRTAEQQEAQARKKREQYHQKHPDAVYRSIEKTKYPDLGKMSDIDVIRLRKAMGLPPISNNDTINIMKDDTVGGLTTAPNSETITTHATNLQSRRKRPQEIRARKSATDDTRV